VSAPLTLRESAVWAILRGLLNRKLHHLFEYPQCPRHDGGHFHFAIE
jgi:hypothetical protein